MALYGYEHWSSDKIQRWLAATKIAPPGANTFNILRTVVIPSAVHNDNILASFHYQNTFVLVKRVTYGLIIGSDVRFIIKKGGQFFATREENVFTTATLDVNKWFEVNELLKPAEVMQFFSDRTSAGAPGLVRIGWQGWELDKSIIKGR